jgi:CubicO group peptidase (beta-lactamase class C family)
MMAHQAGFTPWIPYYKKTLSQNKPSTAYYQEKSDEMFQVKVAEKMFMRKDYVDSMYAILVKTPLVTPKKYVYSDLCFYFQQLINERLTGMKQDVYLSKNTFAKMGLRHITYNPLDRFQKEQIVPTENEQSFRYQLIHGYVHDQGAAMLGGVGGHAGIFANATDVASVMQLFLNNGSYAGQTFFDINTTNAFTKQQFSGNKRGSGFDRPAGSGGGTCGKLASQESFGHSGFTGTLAWADPKDNIVFVFLSNRVYPDAENWKLRDMGIRTAMQDAFYEACAKIKKN